MTDQNNAAAERSAHVERGPAKRIPGESFLVETSPGIFKLKAVVEAEREIERLRAEVHTLSTTCGHCGDLERAWAAVAAARREGFLAALEMAERRCEDAARYVRLRARSVDDHAVASTYEQAGAMVRALPVPEVFRVPTGLEYRGG